MDCERKSFAACVGLKLICGMADCLNLSGMSVEALMDLRKRVDEMLLERRAEIEKRLERMDRVEHQFPGRLLVFHSLISQL